VTGWLPEGWPLFVPVPEPFVWVEELPLEWELFPDGPVPPEVFPPDPGLIPPASVVPVSVMPKPRVCPEPLPEPPPDEVEARYGGTRAPQAGRSRATAASNAVYRWGLDLYPTKTRPPKVIGTVPAKRASFPQIREGKPYLPGGILS
jgi:hypothetical protein